MKFHKNYFYTKTLLNGINCRSPLHVCCCHY